MRPRLFIPLLLGGLLLTLGVLAGACGGGGDDEGGLEEYLQQLEASLQDIRGQFDPLEAEFPQAFVEPEDTRGALNAIAEVTAESHDALDEIEPPEEARQAHSEFLDSAAAYQGFLEDVVGQLAGMDSMAEVEQVLAENASELDAARVRSGAACNGLQDIADENGIAVDLGCGEG
jgi:hypothetical protein